MRDWAVLAAAGTAMLAAQETANLLFLHAQPARTSFLFAVIVWNSAEAGNSS